MRGYDFKKGYPSKKISIINQKETQNKCNNCETIEESKKEEEIYVHQITTDTDKIIESEVIFTEHIRSAQILTSHAILYVIAVVSNPARFERRYQLFNEFCERMKLEKQVVLVTLELQQGSRPFATDATIKLRTHHEIWYKENLINIAVRHLPDDWEFMAWIDADIEFQNKNWVRETLEQLQTYSIVQMFTHCIDLGVKQETLQVHTSFCYAYCNGEIAVQNKKYGNYMHSGYCWAIQRKAYDDIGGLMEFCLLGSADTHMCHCLIGEVDCTLNKKLHPNYILLCKIYQDRCEKSIKRNIGFVHGTILHHFHGNKVDRKYQSRWNILINNQFDPLRDIHHDANGLWVLNDDKIKLRDDIRRYFRERNEDCNTMSVEYKYKKAHWI